MKVKPDLAVEIFKLVLDGDQDAKRYALHLLARLTYDERQQLREASQCLDTLIEETWRASVFRSNTA